MLKSVSSITNAIGALNYKGTWDALINNPTLASGVGVKGDYYVVSVAGFTNLDGITNWGIGDWAVFNGSVWQRVEGGADLNGVNLTVTNDALINLVYIGRGGGNVASNTRVGNEALANNTNGFSNTAFGKAALNSNTTGDFNTASGFAALASNVGGNNNTAFGALALSDQPLSNNNTAVGYAAGYVLTGASNTLVGAQAGFDLSTADNNTLIGATAGSEITTGDGNVVVGNYDGNNGTLDIRTTNNYVVLSDGAGNIKQYWDGSGNSTQPAGNFTVAGDIDSTSGSVSAAAYKLKSSGIITEAGTTRTLSAGDNGKVIYCTSGSAVTITCATGLGAGFSCTIVQAGAGKVTVAAGAATLNSYGGFFSTIGQYAVISLISPVADSFIAAGNLGV